MIMTSDGLAIIVNFPSMLVITPVAAPLICTEAPIIDSPVLASITTPTISDFFAPGLGCWVSSDFALLRIISLFFMT